MQGEAVKTKKQAAQEYHFPGGGEYVPQTVLAESREEAEAEYIRTRKPVEKVEPKETNEQ